MSSSLGTQVTFLALPAAAAAAAPRDAQFVAVLEAMTVVGFVLFSLPSGVIADRRDPLRTLVVCSWASAVCMVAVGIGLVRLVTEWATYKAVLVAVLVAIASCIQTQAEASTQRLVVTGVAPPLRPVMNSWVHGAGSGAQLVGPAVVGMLVATVGAAYGLLLDGLSFAVAAVLLGVAARRREPRGVSDVPVVPSPGPVAAPVPVALRRRVAAAVAEGFAGFGILARLERLWAATVVLACANFFAGLYGATYVFYVLQVRDLGGGGLAAVGAAAAVGGLAGATAAPWLLSRVGAGRVLLAAPFGYGALFGLVGAPDGDLVLPAVGVGLYACASALVAIAYVTYRQEHSPEDAAGRVAAASRAVTNGAYPLSAAVAIAALGVLDAAQVITIAVAGEAVTALLLPLWWWRLWRSGVQERAGARAGVDGA
ncbi:MFS transporter [Cellulomonas bogoriensis]|nr:MFS transporter [Cellulomonas bogoriensis]